MSEKVLGDFPGSFGLGSRAGWLRPVAAIFGREEGCPARPDSASSKVEAVKVDPARAEGHPDLGGPAGDDPVLRGDADLFEALGIRRQATGPTSATGSRRATCLMEMFDSRPCGRACRRRTASEKRAQVQIHGGREPSSRRPQARFVDQPKPRSPSRPRRGSGRSQANYDRWDSEYRRIKGLDRQPGPR